MPLLAVGVPAQARLHGLAQLDAERRLEPAVPAGLSLWLPSRSAVSAARTDHRPQQPPRFDSKWAFLRAKPQQPFVTRPISTARTALWREPNCRRRLSDALIAAGPRQAHSYVPQQLQRHYSCARRIARQHMARVRRRNPAHALVVLVIPDAHADALRACAHLCWRARACVCRCRHVNMPCVRASHSGTQSAHNAALAAGRTAATSSTRPSRGLSGSGPLG